MRKHLTILLFLLNISIFAQITTSLPYITKPIPSVAAIMNFVDVPVNLYTGVPDINIPIYNFPTRSKDINLGISLNYHPAGVSYLSPASDVGNGWALIADGVISRNVNEGPDRLDNPYPRGFDDEFQFNFLGHSGSFFLKPDPSGILGTLAINAKESTNLKIEWNTDSHYVTDFTVYDDKGYKFVFDKMDRNVAHFDEVVPNYTSNHILHNYVECYNSAWHLTKVFDNNGRLLISYDFAPYNSPTNNIYIPITNKLESISIPGFGTAEFDFDYITVREHTGSDPFQLDGITIKNELNQVIKHYTFSYTYNPYVGSFSTLKQDRRVLNVVKSYNNNDTHSNDYELFYKNDFEGSNTMLPTDYTLYSDEFGYLTYTVPCDAGLVYDEMVAYPTNSKVCYFGVLEKMKLPTGGSYVYKFESNTYSYNPEVVTQIETDPNNLGFDIEEYYNKNPDNTTIVTYASTNYDTALSNPAVTTWQFTVTGSIPKKLYFNFDNVPYYNSPELQVSDDPLQVQYQLSGEGVNMNLSEPIPYADYIAENGNYCLGKPLTLAPGTYTITMNTFFGLDTTGSITISEKVRNTTPKKWVYGGGLRIAKIYYYPEEISLNGAPGPGNYDGDAAKIDTYEYNYFDNPLKSSGNLDYGDYKSAPIGKTYGAQVCYLNVKVKNSDTNGYTKYYFKSMHESPMYTISIGGIWCNYYYSSLAYKAGLLKKSEVYNADDKIITSTENTYELAESGNVIYQFVTNDYQSNYFTYMSWAKLTAKTTKDYFYPTPSSLPNIVQTNDSYTYNSLNKQLAEKNVSNSKGEILKTKYYYHTGNSTFSQNRISEIEKIEAYRDTQLLSSSKIDYFNDFANNASYLPQTIKTSKGAGSLENRVKYNHYDAFGNPLEVQMENGTIISYIWGYNKSQPIAKIENESNLQLKFALGVSDLNSINEAHMVSINNLRSSLPNAMITTYTYIPLVGVSTITDPKGDGQTFMYDSFGRLESVMDNDGNILSSNEYHYRTQN